MTIAPSHRAPFFALLLSGGLLIGAWISQYGFGYQPCTMCYWQRHVHKAVVIVATLALIMARMDLPFNRALTNRAMTLLLVLILLGSAGLALFHSGVEFKWWEGPKVCSGGGTNLPDFSGDDPFSKLDGKIKPPSCSNAVWVFLGLSMASWNALISLGGAVVTAVLGFKHAKS